MDENIVAGFLKKQNIPTLDDSVLEALEDQEAKVAQHLADKSPEFVRTFRAALKHVIEVNRRAKK